uniref:Uncharacterized protein n=1 Tax=Oryza barthii TaxID=65489 RepID=A0A0D3H2L8_9ORYZ
MTFDWHPPDNDDDDLQVRQGQGDLEVNKRWAGRQSARMGGVRQVRGRAVGGSGWWMVAQGQALAGGGNSVDRDSSEGEVNSYFFLVKTMAGLSRLNITLSHN